jgi:hypothetical protein
MPADCRGQGGLTGHRGMNRKLGRLSNSGPFSISKGSILEAASREQGGPESVQRVVSKAN